MAEDVNLGDVRRWAQENGIEVSTRGAIAKDVIERYRHRDQTSLEPPVEESTSDEVVITDSVSAMHADDTPTVAENDESHEWSTADPSDDAGPDKSTSDSPADEKDEWMRRYRAALGIPEYVTDADVAITATLSRNKVSVQTLDNGFIHNQRAVGTQEIQARLAGLGLYSGYAHGLADETTVQAYARFQDNVGLPGTGIPDRVSLEALDFDVIE